MKNSPCYNNGADCPYRTEYCHADCEIYAAWVEDRKREREKAREPAQADAHTKATIAINCKRAKTKRQVGLK